VAGGVGATGRRRIIGWSNFDRDQFARSADVRAAVQGAIRERYVNAITVAKTWRRALLPQWHLEANELKAYFELTGFPPTLRRGIVPAPAMWIAHVEDQIAKRGRYKEAKAEPAAP
jgi:hypothetical protein